MLPSEACPSGSSRPGRNPSVWGTCSRWMRQEVGEHRGKEEWKGLTAAGRMAGPAAEKSTAAAGSISAHVTVLAKAEDEMLACRCEEGGREIWLRQDASSREWPSPLA